MAQPKQTATELSRTLAGQWSKSQKREHASRSIMMANKRTHEINKAFKQKQILSKYKIIIKIYFIFFISSLY